MSNAGWDPSYDLRVDDIKNPLQLVYKASVYQSTGEDWDKIQLNISTGNPRESSQAPILEPIRLPYNYSTNNNRAGNSSFFGILRGQVISSEDGLPLPGVGVQIQGTNIGVPTDVDGRYQLNVPPNSGPIQFSFIGFETKTIAANSATLNVTLEPEVNYLQEVVVTGYASQNKRALQGKAAGVNINQKRETPAANSIDITINETQTNTLFEITDPYVIRSGERAVMVEMISESIPASYQYYAVPKLDEGVFLNAKLTDLSRLYIEDGEANIFFEGTYQGKTYLSTGSLDTVTIGLGRDKAIKVTRKALINTTKNQTIGSNKISDRSWEFSIRNDKNSAIELQLIDQIPVSTLKEITVETTETSGATIIPESGEVKWLLSIPAKQSLSKKLGYTVKYPRQYNLNFN